MKAKKLLALEDFWKSTELKGGVQKTRTGIKGFDETLQGGLPKGRATLITGNTGTGKTIFLNEFLYRGITEFNEPGVFVTLEETPGDIVKNVANFGWDYSALIKKNKLAFVDGSPQKVDDLETTKNYDILGPLLIRIQAAIKRTKAKRVAIDSLSVLFGRYEKFENSNKVRNYIFKLARTLKDLGITVLISAEKKGDTDALAEYDVQEFVVDGVIDLVNEVGSSKIIRTVIVRKMRGVGFRSGRVEYEITGNGVEVYPKIPVNNSYTMTDFKKRYKFGIPKIDEALGGGIPQGHAILVAGTSGTGKSTLDMHFLVEGVKNNEKCVWVALEEPIDQIKKTGLAFGWDLEKYEKEGKIKFVRVPMMDISSNQLLYRILDAVQEVGAKRVIIDSISSLQSSTMSGEMVREFMLQIVEFFKTLGVTCLVNYLVSNLFTARAGQLLGNAVTNDIRLSSNVDGIILLQYVEREQEVKKLLNILKLRGSDHDKGIFEFKITHKGFELGKKYKI